MLSKEVGWGDIKYSFKIGQIHRLVVGLVLYFAIFKVSASSAGVAESLLVH
jgi:hypothetical protein